MANSADPDQLASSEATDLDLHCLQRQDLSGFSRTRVNMSASSNLVLIFGSCIYIQRNLFLTLLFEFKAKTM